MIIKHKASKNAAYTDVLDYYAYKHKEDSDTGHYEPILDEDGLPQLRDNFGIACLTPDGNDADPYEWAANCVSTNHKFRKNRNFGDICNHEYIISHPEADREKLTMEALLEEGKTFAREFLQGYDVLIGVHRDTENDHIHIAINSVRAQEREQKDWMMRNSYGEILRCEYEAGGKHQESPRFRRACNDWLLQYAQKHGYVEENNNRTADERKENRTAGKEDTAQKFPRKERELRNALLTLLPKCKDLPTLQAALQKEYGITLIQRGNTISLRPANATKSVRLRTLGITQDDFWERLGNPSPPKFTMERAAAEKKNIEYIEERRAKNSLRAAEIIRKSELALAAEIKKSTGKYRSEDYRDLKYLIQAVTFLERDLQTEKEKLERFLSRWDAYTSEETSPEERKSCEKFLIWSGVDPDDAVEHRALQLTSDSISAQIQQAVTLRETLIQTAAQWKDTGISYFNPSDFTCKVQTEQELKRQIELVRANRIRLGKAVIGCQRAAERRLGSPKYTQKAEYFLSLWHASVAEERALQNQLKQQKSLSGR